jgi:hypothetical protein
MAELLIPSVRCAYRDFQSVDISKPHERCSLHLNRFQSFTFQGFRSKPDSL